MDVIFVPRKRESRTRGIPTWEYYATWRGETVAWIHKREEGRYPNRVQRWWATDAEGNPLHLVSHYATLYEVQKAVRIYVRLREREARYAAEQDVLRDDL